MAAWCRIFEEPNPPRSTRSGDIMSEPLLGAELSAAPMPGRLPALLRRAASQIEDWQGSRPALIALDDAHWADEMTMFLLRALVPARRARPVLWLLTRRSGAPGGAQTGIDLLVRQGAQLHSLGPIPREAIEQMSAHILGAKPDHEVLRLADRCGGNPFLLEELLTTARDSGRIQVAGESASIVHAGLPEDFVNAVEQHLATLSDQGRWMLAAASVLGRPFSLHEVSRLVARSVPELLPVANEAINAAVLVSDGAKLGFRHELIREALYAGLPSAVRSALHREAATLRQSEGASPVESIEHLIRSGHMDSDEAIALLRQAVSETAPTAPNTAADMILRAFPLIGDREITDTSFVADAVRLLAEAGRFSEATSLAERRLRGNLSDKDEALLLLRMSEALYLSGRHVAVVEMTNHALKRLSPPDEVYTDLLGIQALAFIDAGDYASAERSAKRSLARGEGMLYPTQACCRACRSQIAQARGDLEAALQFAHEAVEIADRTRGEALNRHPRLALCQVLTATDRFSEAETVAERGRRDASNVGGAWARPHYQVIIAELRLAAGRMDDAREESLTGLQDAEDTGSLRPMVQLLALLVRLAIHEADLNQAADYLHRVDQLLATADVGRRDEVTWARAEYCMARNRPAAAFEALADGYGSLSDWPSLLVREPRAVVQLVRMTRQLGRPQQARIVMEATQAVAARNSSSHSLAGVAAHARGLLDGNLHSLRRAVHVLRLSPRPLLRASAMEDLARAEYAAGHHARALELTREAGELYRCGGSTHDHRRTESRLRSWQTPRPRQPHQTHLAEPVVTPAVRPKDAAWRSLSESELRVVRLVAKGLSNREVADRLYLSPHTVDSHLRHSFAKLGVSNRIELTRQVMVYDTGAAELK
jgi:DNA-binding CsgD family transcriptional regulator/tetratricopeptide (TPR) repeat protein